MKRQLRTSTCYILDASNIPSLDFYHGKTQTNNTSRDNNVLEVTLVAGENAVVHASVKNVGAEDLNLLSYGSLFDTAPVQKINVYEGGGFTLSLTIRNSLLCLKDRKLT